MVISLGKTAVKWSWYGDKGWVPYDRAVADKLEQAYQTGKKMYKTDSERFVDFNFSCEDDIKKNFVNMTKETGLVGVQRRSDDHTKRRAVKREVPSLFKDKHFVISTSYSPADVKTLIAAITLYDGSYAKTNWSNKINVFVCSQDDIEDQEARIEKAIKAQVDTVSEKYIIESIANGTSVKTKPYLLNLKKRKSAATTTTTTTTSKKLKPTKKDDEDDSDGDEINGFDKLTPDSTWTGKCTYENAKSYHLIMNISETTDPRKEKKKDKKNDDEGNKSKRLTANVRGTITWPTLNSATTKFKGNFQPNTNVFKFKEYQIIKGEGEVEVPTEYFGKLKGNTISGNVENEEEKCTFQLTLSKNVKKPKIKMDEDENKDEDGSIDEGKAAMEKNKQKTKKKVKDDDEDDDKPKKKKDNDDDSDDGKPKKKKKNDEDEGKAKKTKKDEEDEEKGKNKSGVKKGKSVGELKPGDVFTGHCLVEKEFEMVIKTRKGEKVNGTITRPSKAKTTFSGTLESQTFTFKELDADADADADADEIQYVAKLGSSPLNTKGQLLKGTFGANKDPFMIYLK